MGWNQAVGVRQYGKAWWLPASCNQVRRMRSVCPVQVRLLLGERGAVLSVAGRVR